MAKTSSQSLSALKAVPMFSALDDEPLGEFARECLRTSWAAGESIFTPHQKADRFFVVLDGRVKIFKLSPRGDEQILHLYGRGETFGEAAMWSGGTFPAHAEAVADTALLVVHRDTLRRAVAREPDLAMAMLAGLSAKLREFNALIEDLSLKKVPARVARVLLAESAAAGSATFRLRQTKRQLAAQIGTAAETLSRTLGKLKAQRLIDVDGSKITILAADGLAELAAGG